MKQKLQQTKQYNFKILSFPKRATTTTKYSPYLLALALQFEPSVGIKHMLVSMDGKIRWIHGRMLKKAIFWFLAAHP